VGRGQMSVRWVVVLMLIGRLGWGQTPSGNDREARRLFDEGQRHYNLGEYEQAIAQFKEDYRLSEAPLLLFNIAQAYRLLGPGNCDPALQFYARYLRADPQTLDRNAIEQRMAELTPCAQRERDQKSEEARQPANGQGLAPAQLRAPEGKVSKGHR